MPASLVIRLPVENRRLLCTALVFPCMTGPASVHAADSTAQEVLPESESVRLYRTREEQRDAGLKRQLTPWLTFSGLAEGELGWENFDTRNGTSDDSGRDTSASLQLGLAASYRRHLSAEIILEYDTDRDRAAVDEASVNLETDPWELSLGRLYTPLGVYFSNFASGPLLEFGETRAREAATLAWGPDDDLDISLTVYRGRARKQGQDSNDWNWSLATETWLNHAWSFGLSYQSDLADADSRLLEDSGDRYSHRVAAVSGYLLWAHDQVEVTVEGLAATGSFRELARDRNRPRAWNAELAYFVPGSNFEIAVRIEGSAELEDAPAWQAGSAVTWRTGKYASLTLEYLHGEFSDGMAVTEDGRSYDHVDRVGALFSLAF